MKFIISAYMSFLPSFFALLILDFLGKMFSLPTHAPILLSLLYRILGGHAFCVVWASRPFIFEALHRQASHICRRVSPLKKSSKTAIVVRTKFRFKAEVHPIQSIYIMSQTLAPYVRRPPIHIEVKYVSISTLEKTNHVVETCH